MTNKIISLLLLFSCCLFFSCKHEKKPSVQKVIDPLQAALPHGDTLPDSELSEVDRQKLATAIGKEVETIHTSELLTLIDSSAHMLHAYFLWKVDCNSCVEQHKLLQKLQQDVGEDQLKLVSVNLDVGTERNKVNTNIRLLGFHNEAYMLNDLEINKLPSLYHDLFSSKLPTLLFVNSSNDTFIFYERTFEYGELYATTQPLLM